MGSGVLPAGAYVTLEHEYILILRKGGKREFCTAADREDRQESALFWEERNQWFSDIWMDLKGTRQNLIDKNVRKRSGAFPFELPYRLINMYSVKRDTVLDPFLGTGTTMFAAMASRRNSIGIEIDKNFLEVIDAQLESIVSFSNDHIRNRLERHEAFVRERQEVKGPLKYLNRPYGFPVIMNQEKNLSFNFLKDARKIKKGCFEVEYVKASETGKYQPADMPNSNAADASKTSKDQIKENFQQLELKL